MNVVQKALTGLAGTVLAGSVVYGIGMLPSEQIVYGKHATNFEAGAYNFRVNVLAGPPVPSVCEKTKSGVNNLGDKVGKLNIVDYRVQPGTIPGAPGPAINLPVVKKDKQETDAAYTARLKKRDTKAIADLKKVVEKLACSDTRYAALLGSQFDTFGAGATTLQTVESTSADFKKQMSEWDEATYGASYWLNGKTIKFASVDKKTPVVQFQQVGKTVKLVQGATAMKTNVARVYDGKDLVSTLDLDYGLSPVFDSLQKDLPVANDVVVCKYDATLITGSTPCKDLKKAAKAAKQRALDIANGIIVPSASPTTTPTPSPTSSSASGL